MKNENEILNIITKDLKNAGYEPQRLNDEGVDSVGFVMPLMKDGVGKVYVQMFFRPLTEEMSRLVFFTVLINGCEHSMADLEKALPQWNLEAAIGCYGVSPEEGQLFHKYDLLTAEDDQPLEIGLQTQRVLYALSQELVGRLGVARALATGKMTLAAAKQKGYC